MKIIWFIFIGWWYLPIKWTLKNIIKLIDAKTTHDLNFEIKTWDNFAENIRSWQSKNTRNQWENATFSEKPLYEYSWEEDIPVNFVAEPTNVHDSNAIAVYLDGLHIGYVPREINENHHDFILGTGTALASIHGGDRKRLDEFGNVVLEEFNPIVEINISK